MSVHIGEERRLRALEPPAESENGQPSPHWIIRAATVFSAVTALAGVGCLTAAFALEEWRTAVLGMTLVIVSAVAGAVLVWDRLMADRQEFYRRGQLDGWMRGWRGQEPEGADPLWKRSA